MFSVVDKDKSEIQIFKIAYQNESVQEAKTVTKYHMDEELKEQRKILAYGSFRSG